MKCNALFILLFLPICSVAQNLVPNGSFEEYEECPDGLGQVNLILGWDSILNSCDYFNVCSEMVGIPNSSEFYQDAFDGSGFVGLLTYPYPPEIFYREVLGTTLLEPLEIGETYYFSFRINKADKSTNQKASNNIGLKFLTELPNDTEQLIDNTCHWKIDSICYDTVNWNLVQGQITAEQAYLILCIGNFFDNENTLTDGPGTVWDRNAYYLIDDFRLSNDSTFAWSTSIGEDDDFSFSIFPTVSGGTPISVKGERSFRVSIFDTCGRTVFHIYSFLSEIEIDISNYDNGLYFFLVEGENRKRKCFKVIKYSQL